MGVLSDFVVAGLADAPRVCASNRPGHDFAGLDARGIDTVKLATLHAILTGGEVDPSFMSDTLCSSGDDGPWVFEVPTDLVQRLAQLDAPERGAVGAAWASTEEFSPRYDDWPAEAVQQVLEDLAALCRRTAAEGEALLLWMCL